MQENAVTVNGTRVTVDGASVHTTTLDWLRTSGFPGSKEGCAEGECGACAILVATPAEGGAAWTPVNSCLVPVYALAGQEIVTVEGLGTPDALHPVQRALAAGGGSQCGYCTPGFVCAMAGEYYRADRVPGTAEDLSAECHTGEEGPNGFDLHALSGNLCRCTGYRPIRDAAFALGAPTDEDPLQQRLAAPVPPASPISVEVDRARFVRPDTLAEALRLLREEPDAMVIAGCTDWGVEVTLGARRAPLVVAIERLDDLRILRVTEDEVQIGAALTLSEVERGLAGRVPLLAKLLPQFASRLIRNRATLGGNLGTGSPIGDAAPALLALGARAVLVSETTDREVDLSEYFTGYRQSVRRSDELIRAVRFRRSEANVTAFHKIAKRRFDDISSVAIAFALTVQDGVVQAARVGLGGVAATPIRARATERALLGAGWDMSTVEAAAGILGREGTPLSDHRASAEYRSLMLQNSLLKLFSTSTAPSTKDSKRVSG